MVRYLDQYPAGRNRIRKAIFLDRDGVINTEVGHYVWKKADFTFTDDFFPFAHAALDKGFVLIVITNQGGIAKGLYTAEAVDQLHAWMQAECARHGVEFLDIRFSPNHSEYSSSLDRKPGSLMIERAAAIHEIRLSDSWMIGDKHRDMQAGRRAGCRTALLGTDESPDADVRLEFLTELLPYL